jgi:hypothetical protein
MSEFEIRKDETTTGCVRFASLFQDPLLEEPPSSSAPAATRHQYNSLTQRAAAVCGSCPLQSSCLYEAVVEHDVNGYVAGTTQRQRTEIRRQLHITVEPEDFDTFAGATARNRPVDHDEVVRLRKANPDETLESIAQRLGCSLSTVKRHLRRERNAARDGARVASIRPTKPTVAKVMSVAAQVVTATRQVRRAA